MYRGYCGGFGDDQQRGLTCQGPQRRRNMGKAPGGVAAVAVAEDTQPRAGDLAQNVLTVFREEIVGAEADEGEVMIVHPAQEMQRLFLIIRRHR